MSVLAKPALVSLLACASLLAVGCATKIVSAPLVSMTKS